MTYGELKALLISFAHRSDVPTADLIELARQRINRDLRVREMIVRLTFTPTQAPHPLPADFLEMREVFFNDGSQRVSVQLVSRKELAWYANANASSASRFASIDGTDIEFIPSGVGREFTMLYYAAVPQLVSDAQTHPTLELYSPIWLDAALIALHNWTQDSDLQAEAMSKYTSEVESANRASGEAEGGAMLQMAGASNWHG